MELSGTGTPLDFVVLAVVVFSAVMGLSNGLVHSVLFISAWIGAAAATAQFTQPLQKEVEKFVANEQVAHFATMLGIFVVALMVLTMIATGIGKLVRASPFRIPDRILGLGFGALCGGLLLSTALLFYTYIAKQPDPPPIIKQAWSYPTVKAGADVLEPYLEHLPESFKTRLRSVTPPGTTPPTETPPAPPLPPKQ